MQKGWILSPLLVFFTNNEGLENYSLLASLRLNANKGGKVGGCGHPPIEGIN